VGDGTCVLQNDVSMTNSGKLWDNGVNSFILAQSFTSVNKEISAIDLYWACSNMGNPFCVYITKNSPSNTPDMSSKVIEKCYKTLCNTRPFRWVKDDLPDANNLIIGNTYWIVVYDSNSGYDPLTCGGRGWVCYNEDVGWNSNNQYAYGKLVVSTDGMRTWTDITNSDLLFRLYSSI